MAHKPIAGEQAATDAPPECVAGGAQCHPLATAQAVGETSAAAATAPASAQAIARRNEAETHKPLNSVMEAAITAWDLARRR